MGFLADLVLVDFLGIVVALLLVAYAYFKWSFTYWKRRNIPYIEPSIPFGNFHNPWNKTLSIGEDLQLMYNIAKGRGYKHCGIYNTVSADYLIMDLDIAKQIGIKDSSNFLDRGTYSNEKDDPLSAHLFAIGGQKWKNTRSKMSPSFTSGKMKTMFPILQDYALLLETFLEEHVNNKEGPIDIKSVLGGFSNDIIASIAFGLDCNSYKEPDSPFRENARKFFQQNSYMALRTMFNLNFPNLARALGSHEIRTDVTEFFMKLVTDAVDYRQKNNFSRNDFLQLMIDYRKSTMEKGAPEFTLGELAAQCFVFWLAGFETSSATMTFAIYEMTRNPEIQEKARQEIQEILAKYNNKLPYESLSELKYMDQIIDETLRQYPAVPFITRQAAENYKIPGEDIVLEKGTRVNMSILGFHYDEEYFKDPYTFDPDRFSEVNRAKIHPMAHMPFGIGPRLCIGKRFALMQSKVGLVSILGRYRLTLNEKTMNPLKIDPYSIVPLPIGGVWINVEKV